jgi:hypothetical protein
MIGPDLEGAGPGSRVASYRRDTTRASPGAVRSGTHGGQWKITQDMRQQMPEQSGGDCSGI